MKWRVIDPMSTTGNESIERKVYNALVQADAIILIRPSNPNVAHEAGFAKALGKPLIVLRAETGKKPPSDFGDVEYLDYPANQSCVDGWLRFDRKIKEVLEDLKKNKLSASACLLRKRANKISTDANQLIDNDKCNYVIMRMVSGWFGKISTEVQNSASVALRISPDYYSSCMSALHDFDDVQIKAIADLTIKLEEWKGQSTALWKGVRERIFHIDWEDIFNQQKLEEHIDTLRENEPGWQQHSCEVYLITTRESVEKIRHPHPLGPDSTGRHLLIIDSGIVGGYIKENGTDKLVLLAADRELCIDSAKYYSRLRSLSVRVSQTHIRNVRTSWLQAHKIGQWQEQWDRGVEQRNYDYFNDYDRHIRCWIPRYDFFIQECKEQVQQEILRTFRFSGNPISVLEIGYGTGSLTSEIVSWIMRLNAPLYELGSQDGDPKQFIAVSKYFGIDRSTEMRRLASARLDARGVRIQQCVSVELTTMEFRANSRNRFGKKLHVIFGTLVFHFILGENPSEGRIVEILKNISNNWLDDGGSLVLADVFFREGQQQEQLESWRKYMEYIGLTAEHIDAFFVSNKDMTTAPTVESFEKAANKAGFKMFDRQSGLFEHPFEVIVLKKQNGG